MTDSRKFVLTTPLSSCITFLTKLRYIYLYIFSLFVTTPSTSLMSLLASFLNSQPKFFVNESSANGARSGHFSGRKMRLALFFAAARIMNGVSVPPGKTMIFPRPFSLFYFALCGRRSIFVSASRTDHKCNPVFAHKTSPKTFFTEFSTQPYSRVRNRDEYQYVTLNMALLRM